MDETRVNHEVNDTKVIAEKGAKIISVKNSGK